MYATNALKTVLHVLKESAKKDTVKMDMRLMTLDSVLKAAEMMYHTAHFAMKGNALTVMLDSFGMRMNKIVYLTVFLDFTSTDTAVKYALIHALSVTKTQVIVWSAMMRLLQLTITH